MVNYNFAVTNTTPNTVKTILTTSLWDTRSILRRYKKANNATNTGSIESSGVMTETSSKLKA